MVVALVATAIAVTVGLTRSPASGDVAWSADVDALDLGGRPSVAQTSGDLSLLQGRDAAAVVDGDGDLVITDLSVNSYALREDGSGWGTAAGSSIDDVNLVGWDESGTTTFEFLASADLESTVGVSVEDTSVLTIDGYTDDVVVLTGCWDSSSTAEDATVVRLALDAGDGQLLWQQVDTEERCYHR